MLNTFKSIAAAALIAIVPISTTLAEQSPINDVLVIVSSESLQTQGMAMVLANTMAQQGAQVDVLLCDQAGDLALANYNEDNSITPLKPRDVTPGQMLRGLIQQGGTAAVCALYLPNSDHEKSDLIDRVTAASPGDIAARMLDPDTRVFNF